MMSRFALLLPAAMLLGSCSVLLDKQTAQCESDRDCARFSMTVCDRRARVCVASPADAATADVATSSDTADSCQGPAGCYACQPSNDDQVQAACTDSTCIPFDNKRVTTLNPDGTLKPLP